MDWFVGLFTTDSVAHAVLILSLVAAIGLALGSVRIFGFTLGIAGALFAGLGFGYYGIRVNHEVLEFAREFGLILFVFTIGLQVGPGFLSSFRRQGITLTLLASAVVLLGVGVTLAVCFFGGVEMPVAVGLFSGGTTNTPSLGAAQHAIRELLGAEHASAQLPSVGYAIAYPFGILGIILAMIVIRVLFRIRPHDEATAFAHSQRRATPALSTANIEVKNPNLDGVAIQKIPALEELGVVISRILHQGIVHVATPEVALRLGDVVLAVGPKERLDQFRVIVGAESVLDLHEIPGPITTRRIIVTRRAVLGKALDDLELWKLYGVTVTRISRADIEFTPNPNVRLQFGDTVLAVGEAESIERVAKALGNSAKQMQAPQMIPLMTGIALGVVAGSWPVHLPGMAAPMKLGLAGGSLVVAMVLSRVGRLGSLIWYLPISANAMLRELGIALFLACVGLGSGERFFAALLQGPGLQWMGWAALITFVPILIVGLIARIVYKLNYVSVCGLLAGSMTDPPALAFAHQLTGSDTPSVAYATVYPFVMLLRVVSAQLLVLLFVR